MENKKSITELNKDNSPATYILKLDVKVESEAIKMQMDDKAIPSTNGCDESKIMQQKLTQPEIVLCGSYQNKNKRRSALKVKINLDIDMVLKNTINRTFIILI